MTMTKSMFSSFGRWSIPFVLRAAVTLLLQQVLCGCSKAVVAFVLPSSPTRRHASANPLLETWTGRQRIRRKQSINKAGSITVATAVASTSTDDTPATELYGTATQLLGLLLEKRNQDIEPPFEAWLRRNTRSYERLEAERKSAVEALIEELTLTVLGEKTQEARGGYRFFLDRIKPQPKSSPPCYYDPVESLFSGGFYCTLYFYYPNFDSGSSSKPPEDPIWEKTSLRASNIKGQQYYVRNDFQQSVINYSEVWGADVTLKAEGVLTPIDDEEGSIERSAKGKQSPRPQDRTKKDSRNLRRLPDIFRVDATKISASIFGLSLDFNIQGSANLVVLYADPRIRIFVSPLPSETVVGNWEEAGLVVVQVRGDLVPAENESITQLIDLR